MINDSPPLTLAPQINPKQIYGQYVESLSDQKEIYDLQNAVVRYFVPSLSGPVPAAQKRRPLSPEDIQAALNFLETLSLEALSHAPDVALARLEQLGSSTIQKNRVRRSLRDLVDWALSCNYLAAPENPVPEGICRHIQVGKYAGLPLKKATVRQISEQYLASLKNSECMVDTMNALVRFFGPGCGGPMPWHKPARPSEVQAAMTYLETVPLEYLDEALAIVTPVMQALDISQTQQTRIRKAVRGVLRWARDAQYLPKPHSVAPWGKICRSQSPSDLRQGQSDQPQTLRDSYDSYGQNLKSIGKEATIASLQSTIVRYFVPAWGGHYPVGNKATQSEVQAALDFLHTLPLEHLNQAIELLEKALDQLDLPVQKRQSISLPVRKWIEWGRAQAGYRDESLDQEPEPIFNTFRPLSSGQPRSKPGAEMQSNRCPPHALCAKHFSGDYINLALQQQLESYHQWRLQNDVTEGSITTEKEQILQVLGWLHRHEGVALDILNFEHLITKSQLIFIAEDYSTYEEYLRQEKIGTQKARTDAAQSLERVKRYFDFVGKKSRSLSRRTFIVLTIAKFLYRDVLGSDDFPDERDIPVLRRLLDLQSEKKKREKRSPQTISYSETSVSWEDIIYTMEQQRLRSEQRVTYVKTDNAQGYWISPRPDTALANELQRFLSIIFCVLIPSRSRTFYDLRIEETFKEGILTDRKFMSVQELKNRGLWEQHQGDIQFCIHHLPDDFKTGKSMTPAMLETNGWWVELPNIRLGSTDLYEYIRRWLTWGRAMQGDVSHNFFFRACFSTRSLNTGDWNNRIKTMINCWTGVPVPPKNLRKIFASQYPEHAEAVAVLLQHSERIQRTDYDMRSTVKKVQPVMDANRKFIQNFLSK